MRKDFCRWEGPMQGTTQRRELDELFSVTYEELRRLANRVLRDEHAAKITPTTLVNEAWLKLARSPDVAATSALHFRRIAARAMRQILVDAARFRQAQIHGGGALPITFDAEIMGRSDAAGRDVLALDSALDQLALCSPRQAELVEMRFFGGYTCLECAELLEVSEATIMRQWRAARAFLALRIKQSLATAAPLATNQRER